MGKMEVGSRQQAGGSSSNSSIIQLWPNEITQVLLSYFFSLKNCPPFWNPL